MSKKKIDFEHEFDTLRNYEEPENASSMIFYNSRIPTMGVYTKLPYTLYKYMILDEDRTDD